MFQTLYSIHASSWAILVITFFITYFIQKRKVPHMILRLFYVVMLGTGIGMLSMMQFPATYVVKGLLAVILIAVMEIMLSRRKKQLTLNGFIWGALLAVLTLILLFGFNVISL